MHTGAALPSGGTADTLLYVRLFMNPQHDALVK
jgi:hypothetical protein